MLKQSITCDACKEDISLKGRRVELRLAAPGSLTRAPVRDLQHFCDWSCFCQEMTRLCAPKQPAPKSPTMVEVEPSDGEFYLITEERISVPAGARLRFNPETGKVRL